MTHTSSDTASDEAATSLASFGAYLDARRAELVAAALAGELRDTSPPSAVADHLIGALIASLVRPASSASWGTELLKHPSIATLGLEGLHVLIQRVRVPLLDAALDAVVAGVPTARVGIHTLLSQIEVIYDAVTDVMAEARKQREAEIRRISNRLDQTMATTPLATIEWDTQGTITRWNAAAERTFGWTAAEAVGKNIFHLVVPGEQIPNAHEVAASVLRSDHASSLRHENLHRDGRIITCQWYNATLRDEGGQVLGAFSQIEDVTEMLRAETALRESQEQLIQAQEAALRELSTPLIPLDEGVVAMPLIGAIDSVRAQQVIETLLEGVSVHHARVAILDITGVSVVDTQVANGLIRAAQAVKLLGAQVVLTGIRPEVAQTLVGLGVELTGIATRSSLRAGIQYALASRG